MIAKESQLSRAVKVTRMFCVILTNPLTVATHCKCLMPKLVQWKTSTDTTPIGAPVVESLCNEDNLKVKYAEKANFAP